MPLRPTMRVELNLESFWSRGLIRFWSGHYQLSRQQASSRMSEKNKKSTRFAQRVLWFTCGQFCFLCEILGKKIVGLSESWQLDCLSLICVFFLTVYCAHPNDLSGGILCLKSLGVKSLINSWVFMHSHKKLFFCFFRKKLFYIYDPINLLVGSVKQFVERSN